MTAVAMLALEVGGLLLGAAVPWRVGVGRRLAAVREPGGAAQHAHGGRAPRQVARADRRVRAAANRDVVLLLDLLDMAVTAGAGVPRALEAVGEAVGGADGERLTRVSVELLLGAPWSAAWAGTSDGLRPVAECLEAAWVHGAAPGPALRARAGVIRRDRRRAAREAAGRLGVHLVLPLGLCFLPAFVLLGLVPVMVSLASGFAL
ncbi:MAG: secretion system protein [Cellulomonas sp.]|nr:secretion system protein [Cellulomonas sp.]